MNRISKIFNYFFIGFSYLASKKLIAVLIVILFVGILKTKGRAFRSAFCFFERLC
jgi:hypothetical protein